MNFRNDIVNILDEIESELQDICSDLEVIKGIDEVDDIRSRVNELLKKLY